MISFGLPINRIVELMVAQPNDLNVATEGAQALWNKANNNDDDDDDDDANHKDTVIVEGGHIQLLKAITAHPSDAKLSEYASRALYVIADGPNCPRSAALIGAGAGPVLATIARTHSGEAKEFAEDALRGLGLRSDGMPTVYYTFQKQINRSHETKKTRPF